MGTQLFVHFHHICNSCVSGQSEECDNFQHELRGVIPRSFEHLFNLISREHELVSKYLSICFHSLNT